VQISQKLDMKISDVTVTGDCAAQFQMSNRLATKVRGTVYAVMEDGKPDPDLQLPPLWDNDPLDGESPLIFLKMSKNPDGSTWMPTF